jgi:hypothetical protein
LCAWCNNAGVCGGFLSFLTTLHHKKYFRDFLLEWLNLNIETGTLSGDPPNNDLTSYSGSTYQLTIKVISGTIELSHLVNFHILTGLTWSTPSEVELSEYTFTLEESS